MEYSFSAPFFIYGEKIEKYNFAEIFNEKLKKYNRSGTSYAYFYHIFSILCGKVLKCEAIEDHESNLSDYKYAVKNFYKKTFQESKEFQEILTILILMCSSFRFNIFGKEEETHVSGKEIFEFLVERVFKMSVTVAFKNNNRISFIDYRELVNYLNDPINNYAIKNWKNVLRLLRLKVLQNFLYS